MNELTKLAISAREGNRLALGAFIRQTQADVWKTCHFLGPHGMADDLSQDVFIRMMHALPNFKAESSARTWILSIARHVSIDALRSQRRKERILSLFSRDVEQTPDHSADLHDVISQLDPDQKAAFILTQVLGLTYKEAAKACGCPTGTIRSRVARARDSLVTSLDINYETAK